MTTKIRLTMLCLSGFDCFELGLKILLFLVYESYEISRCRNQNLEITTKATKFLGDLEITTKSEILRWTNHTNPETLSPTNSHHEKIFPRKRSLGAPDALWYDESWRRENFKFVFVFSVTGRKVAETYRNVWNHIVLGSCACFDCFPRNWRRYIAYRIPFCPHPTTPKRYPQYIHLSHSIRHFNALLYFKLIAS